MSEQFRILRVVIASPADVMSERDIVPAVVQELNRSVCADRGLRLEVVRWETDAYAGFHVEGPQGLIDPLLRIQDCDVLIGIFWKRFGTPIKGSGSGAAHEFKMAYEAWKQNRRPQVMVYFNQKSYSPQSKNETDQWGQVLEFRRSFPKEGLWWQYKGSSSFEGLIRNHLTNFVRDNFPVRNHQTETEISGSSALRMQPHSDYFQVQKRIIEEGTRAFVGREEAQKAVDYFLGNHPHGYLIIRGAPGQGKTALSCQLIRRSGYVHHFVSRTGGRTDTRLILRSLIAQLRTQDAVSSNLPETVPELTKAFEEYLSVAALRSGKVVIVIDGLDELPANST